MSDVFDKDDREWIEINKILDNDMYKQLYIGLIKLLASLTGDDYRKLCRQMNITSDKIASLSIIDKSTVYALAMDVVSPIYQHNLSDVRASMEESKKYEFTGIVIEFINKMMQYYHCLQRGYPHIFEKYTKQFGVEMLKLKRDKNDTFYLLPTGSRLGLVITKMENIDPEIYTGAIKLSDIYK